jgi:hypothetical protein
LRVREHSNVVCAHIVTLHDKRINLNTCACIHTQKPITTTKTHTAAEKRWTVFSSLWWLVMEAKYNGVPPALRYLWYLGWRALRQRLYEAHKAVVLWREFCLFNLRACLVVMKQPQAQTHV